MQGMILIGIAMTAAAVMAYLKMQKPAAPGTPALPAVALNDEVHGNLQEIVGHLQAVDLAPIGELIASLISRDPVRTAKSAFKLLAALRSKRQKASLLSAVNTSDNLDV